MATLVQDINDALEARLIATLPGTYEELRYKLDISQNDLRANAKQFGVRPLEGVPGISILKHYTMSQQFEVILTEDFVNRDDDSDQQQKSFDLFDKMDDIFIDLINTKGGLAGITILNISSPVLAEPEFLE